MAVEAKLCCAVYYGLLFHNRFEASVLACPGRKAIEFE